LRRCQARASGFFQQKRAKIVGFHAAPALDSMQRFPQPPVPQSDTNRIQIKNARFPNVRPGFLRQSSFMSAFQALHEIQRPEKPNVM
jgi:hypothetical protein